MDPRPARHRLAGAIASANLSAIIGCVRQLITRLDDELHLRLKEKARGVGKSVNSYVTEVLREAVSRDDAKARLKERLRDEGRLVVPPVSGAPPGRAEVIAQLRGASDVVLESIDSGRAPR